MATFVSTYEKCLHCHLFIELNTEAGEGIAPYLHMHRDDEADRLIDESHEAAPSGMIATLYAWKAYGPLEMRQRFTDYDPTQQPYVLVTDGGVAVSITTHPNEQEALNSLRVRYAVGDEVADADLVQFVCDQGVVVYFDSI